VRTAFLSALPLLLGCGSSPGATITASEVVVSSGNMELTFTRGASFGETYMVFGGMVTDRADMITKATVVGLGMEAAIPIFNRFPDFHRCSSPGASLAQGATRQMNIVPANPQVQSKLEQTLAAHEASIQQGGDRVCVRLEGDVLEFASARIDGEDISDQLPHQLRQDCYLVVSAGIVDAQSALAGP